MGQMTKPTVNHSTEGRWLDNHVKGQSHQAQVTKGKKKDVSQIFLNTSLCI